MDAASQAGFGAWPPGELAVRRSSPERTGHWREVRCDLAEVRLASLTQAIETEIIPRLVLAHKSGPEVPVAHPIAVTRPSHAEVIELTGIVMTQGAADACAYVEVVQARGVALESIYLDLLAPVANYLGELWTADLCDFTAVTIGTGHLQQVLRKLTESCPIDVTYNCQNKRAVFAPALGEQHTLGLAIVAELFVNAGWNACLCLPTSPNSLAALVRNEWFDLIGLSVGSEGQLDWLAEQVRSSRRASRNSAVVILVGGPVFVAHPELAARVGADATAVDGKQALAKAERLVSQPSADRSSAY